MYQLLQRRYISRCYVSAGLFCARLEFFLLLQILLISKKLANNANFVKQNRCGANYDRKRKD